MCASASATTARCSCRRHRASWSSVTDTLVEGVHFPRGSPPASIGHRAFAVNLSDLAAMGAEPAWGLLALTMPDSDEDLARASSRVRPAICAGGMACRWWAATPRADR